MKLSSPARHPQVVHHELAGGKVVLLHLESGAYHELNPIGAAIWNLVDGRRSASRISAELHAQLDDPPSDLQGIVSHFLAQLRERGLLH